MDSHTLIIVISVISVVLIASAVVLIFVYYQPSRNIGNDGSFSATGRSGVGTNSTYSSYISENVSNMSLNSSLSSTSFQRNMSLDDNFGGVNSYYGRVQENSFLSRDNCSSLIHAQWSEKNERCECTPGYYGPLCDRQKHDGRYLSMGNIVSDTPGNVQMQVVTTMTGVDKSFSSSSCSVACDNDPNCTGFTYADGNCSLLHGSVIIGSNSGLEYSHVVDSQLYMRHGTTPVFMNKVFVAASLHALPKRFWAHGNDSKFASLTVGTVSHIDFAPTVVKSDAIVLGVYSFVPFTLQDVRRLIEKSSRDTHIHQPGTTLSLPQDWKFRVPLYVVYIFVR